MISLELRGGGGNSKKNFTEKVKKFDESFPVISPTELKIVALLGVLINLKLKQFSNYMTRLFCFDCIDFRLESDLDNVYCIRTGFFDTFHVH